MRQYYLARHGWPAWHKHGGSTLSQSFQALSERFARAASAADSDGPGLTVAASVEAAQAAKHDIEAGLLSLPVYRQLMPAQPSDEPAPLVETTFPWPEANPKLPPWTDRERMEREWEACWILICNEVAAHNPDEFCFDPSVARLLHRTDDGEVRYMAPDDWRERAEHYARICEWLQARQPQKPPAETAGFMSHADLAAKHHIGAEALRKRLENWRYTHDDGYVTVQNRRPTDPQFLYSESAVLPIIEKLKARAAQKTSGKHPAKKTSR